MNNLRSLKRFLLFWLGVIWSAKARKLILFRSRLQKGSPRFYDPENKKPVYQWYDQSGFVYLGQTRWGRMVFFSHEDIEHLPRQQRRKALREIDKHIQKAKSN